MAKFYFYKRGKSSYRILLISYCNQFQYEQRIYYIHKGKMFDIYHGLVPLFSIITLLNLITLKLALRDNVTLSKIVHKKQANQVIKKQSEEDNQIRGTIKFLLVSYTPMEFFSIRRAKYKIGFFFALSIVTITSYFLHSPFAAAPLGTVVFLVYFVLGVFVNKTANQENLQQSKIVRQQNMQIGFCVITLVVNLIVIGLVYKNYQNTLLTTFITNGCINSVLDNFLVRPLALVLISLPLSRNASFITFIKQQKKKQKYLEVYDEIGQKQMLLNQQKKDSPSKNLTKIQLNLEIEPMPFQEVVQVQPNVEELVLTNALDILRKIKNEQIQPPMNINLDKNVEVEFSLNDTLLNENKKEQNSEPLQKNKFQQIPQNFTKEQIAENEIYNENVVVVNPSRHEQIENEQQIPVQQVIKENIVEQDNISSQKQETYRKKQLQIRPEEQNEIVRISLQSSIQPSSRQQPLRIYLNSDFNIDQEDQKQEFEQEIQIHSLKRKKQFQTIDQNSNRNVRGVLQIKKQNGEQRQEFYQIQEIDLNSPERRRRHIVQIQVQNTKHESKNQVVKRKKKRSHDHGHNRVLKFNTGLPYLEYLPHMLEKDSKGKKSQSINKKDVIMEHRTANTGKKTKKRLCGPQNNQNNVQVFRIQDL